MSVPSWRAGSWQASHIIRWFYKPCIHGRPPGVRTAPGDDPGRVTCPRSWPCLGADRALKEAFGHDGPALVDVRTARHELALPPKLTYGEIKGFTLYSTRTILSGGGEELVELAKTNLHELDIE